MNLINFYILYEDLKSNIYSLDKNMPDSALFEMINWKVIKQSPYSYSYYNSENKSWNFTEDKSYRISDHWNFISNGEKHCETIGTLKSGFSLGQYDKSKRKYKILKNFGLQSNGFAWKYNKELYMIKNYLNNVLLTNQIDNEKLFNRYLEDLTKILNQYHIYFKGFFRQEFLFYKKLLKNINTGISKDKFKILNQSRQDFYRSINSEDYNYHQNQEIKYAFQNKKIPFNILKQITNPKLSSQQMRNIRMKY